MQLRLRALLAGRRGGGAVLLLVGLLAVIPPLFALVGLDYYVIVLTQALILGILAISGDLAWGSTGIFTLGQAVFFGIGAYTVGMLAVNFGVTDLVIASVIGLGVGALAGALVGLFLFVGSRVGELYVGLVTLALAYAAERLAAGWDVLGSANGIPGVPAPTLGPFELSYGPSTYYAILVLFALALGAAYRINGSQFGLVMRAVRDDGERAEFLGYRRTSVQILVFTLTSGLAGLAGALYALEEGFVSPSFLGVALSTQVLLWVVLGGRGTLIGPLLGLAVVRILGGRVAEVLPQLWPIVLGVLLLGTILYLPGGLLGRRKTRHVRQAMTPGGSGAVPGPAPEPAAERAVAEPTPPVLEVRGIRKEFGALVALESADLDVSVGEVVGLIGPNGSGKSTLLHVISGRTSATSGSVRLGGSDVTHAKPSDRVRAGLAIKFQLARVYLDQTVADNLLLAVQSTTPLRSLLLSRTWAQCAGRIDDLLEAFHLTDARSKLARELSHGQQQWLEIAMAMALRPTVLLLDEPTAGMSPEERQATGERIRAAREGCGVLIVEHDLDFIRGLCDRISVLHQGLVIATGTPAAIEADARVQEVYLTRV